MDDFVVYLKNKDKMDIVNFVVILGTFVLVADIWR